MGLDNSESSFLYTEDISLAYIFILIKLICISKSTEGVGA
jgi:hypothetical protein